MEILKSRHDSSDITEAASEMIAQLLHLTTPARTFDLEANQFSPRRTLFRVEPDPLDVYDFIRAMNGLPPRFGTRHPVYNSEAGRLERRMIRDFKK